MDFLLEQWQPQSEMLDATQYHAMMTDPVKYVLYREAIYQAMVEQRREKLRSFCSNCLCMTVCVAGAGFGKLVDMTIDAALRENNAVNLQIIVIEHNPTAVAHLRTLRDTKWERYNVTIHQGDMRTVARSMPASVDIFVSELLGGFGDNELAPECLAGSAKIMLRDTGVSIPQKTSSYIAPVAFNAYHHAAQLDEKNSMWVLNRDAAIFNAAFLPNRGLDQGRQIMSLLAPPVPLFEFEYPESIVSPEGFVADRSGKIQFSPVRSKNMPHRAHGLAGFFDCHLYATIGFSTVPGYETPNLKEWLPVFFPTEHPFDPVKTAVVMTRNADVENNAVYYTWSIIDHNPPHHIFSTNSTKNTRFAMRLLP